MTPQKTIRFIIIPALLLLLGGCREVPTSIKVGNGPSFALRGSGRLASFRIYGPEPGRKIATPFDAKSLVWRVEPINGYFKGVKVKGLQIEYGSVPSGYKQTVPAGGVPVLSSGEVYYFFGETTNAPPAEGFFYFDGASPVVVKVPGLCQSGVVGDVKPLKCGTNELYTEPKDLAKFVRENRVER